MNEIREERKAGINLDRFIKTKKPGDPCRRLTGLYQTGIHNQGIR